MSDNLKLEKEFQQRVKTLKEDKQEQRSYLIQFLTTTLPLALLAFAVVGVIIVAGLWIIIHPINQWIDNLHLDHIKIEVTTR